MHDYSFDLVTQRAQKHRVVPGERGWPVKDRTPEGPSLDLSGPVDVSEGRLGPAGRRE